MSDNNFDFNLICDFFSHLAQQGPGSPAETIKALSFIGELPADAKIADIGCGTGRQTQTLAENTTVDIVAVDVFPGMIGGLNDRVKRLGLENRITGLVASMDNLPFSENEYDLIWSEGAIYNIGFEKGIREWKKYLKPGGFLVVSEATWFRGNRPEAIEKYWIDAGYAEIDTVSVKISQLEQAGYVPVASFNLPESCWLDSYYKPITEFSGQFLIRNNNSEQAKWLIDNLAQEIAYYEKYKEYYGYTFFIAQKVE